MRYATPKVLELDSTDPSACGHIHGETLRKEIEAMAEIRLSLMLNDTGFTSTNEVLELAKAHLPVLKRFDEALYQELLGIAEGSNVAPELIVILNHYTDMRDLKPGVAPEVATDDVWDPGGCSVLYVPTKNGPVLGQTWDVHGLAMDHVLILRIKQRVGEISSTGDALVFTVAGCLGMTGMNHAGLGVCINNLNSVDARVGVVWPALVRKVLRQPDAEKGRDLIMRAPLGSGHHYTVADQQNFFGIETSGTQKKITQSGHEHVHYHTNHCLDEDMKRTHIVRASSTTFERYAELTKLLSGPTPTSASDMYEALGRVAIVKNANLPNATATCGAFVMDLNARQALACIGPPSQSLFDNTPLALDINP